MTPTEILKEEHAIILEILDAADRSVDSLTASGTFPDDDIEKMVDYFRVFVDSCHHRKEEKILFAKMEEKGMSRENGPLYVMLREHDEGRRQVKKIDFALEKAKSGDAAARREIADALLTYSTLLKSHIEKEDNVLYPMADRLLDDSDKEEIMEAFEKIEAEEIGAGIHEKYHALVHELSGK